LKMCSKIAFGGLVLATAMAVSSATLPAFGAATITLGTTAFVASGGQVAVAAAAIAGLAIAKEALILATLADAKRGRLRGKRQATEVMDFSAMFDGIDKQDVADCGKLLVCHSVSKDEAQRSGEEKAVANFFDDFTTIQDSSYGKFQWAAYAGRFKNPTICYQRYNKCPVSVEALSNLISVQK